MTAGALLSWVEVAGSSFSVHASGGIESIQLDSLGSVQSSVQSCLLRTSSRRRLGPFPA
jgi:hypothetical protein